MSRMKLFLIAIALSNLAAAHAEELQGSYFQQRPGSFSGKFIRPTLGERGPVAALIQENERLFQLQIQDATQLTEGGRPNPKYPWKVPNDAPRSIRDRIELAKTIADRELQIKKIELELQRNNVLVTRPQALKDLNDAVEKSKSLVRNRVGLEKLTELSRQGMAYNRGTPLRLENGRWRTLGTIIRRHGQDSARMRELARRYLPAVAIATVGVSVAKQHETSDAQKTAPAAQRAHFGSQAK